MNSRYTPRTYATPIALCLFFAAVASSQDATKIKVSNPRPVLEVINRLAERYGWQITYEDPPYENANDLADISDQDFRKAHPGRSLIIPRARPFEFTLKGAVGLAAAEKDATLADLLLQHRATGNPGVFRLTSTGSISHIEPSKLLKQSGEVVCAKSILDAPISFPKAPRTSLQTLQLLLATLSERTGVRIAQGFMGEQLLSQAISEEGPHEESAKAVLVRILDDVNRWAQTMYATRHMVWQLLYEPDQKMYYFHLHVVTIQQVDPSGAVTGHKPI